MDGLLSMFEEQFKKGEPYRNAVRGLLRGNTSGLKKLNAPTPVNPNEALDVAMTFAPLGITAFHGSPAKFEAFDSSKIGSSGNGKAYGYGGYFGGTPQIAETYSGETIKYTPTLEKFTNNLNYFIDNSGNYMKVRDYVKNDIPSKVSKDEYMNKFNETMNLFNNQPEKNLYKVDIPDEKLPYMLDWNLPLSKQTKEIQSIVKNNPDLLKEAQYISGKQDPTGMNIYHSKGTGKEASDYFSNLGIYGNKYLDLQSKKDMNPVSNYVVYNPETVKILERNGLLLP
jgi:hypothetical protein